MKLIVWADINRNISMFGQRVARDSKVIEHMIEIVGDKRLFICDKSIGLFSEYPNKTAVFDKPMDEAGEEDYVFLDTQTDIPWRRVTELIVYNWNRGYPGDRQLIFPADLPVCMDSFETLSGSSHKVITVEKYKRYK